MHKVLGMSCRPSEILEIYDPYTAFCFDEACAYIIQQINDGKEPIIKREKLNEVVKPQTYKKASDLYSKFTNVKINS